jgi:uncharacterized protein (TIGR03435 family)
MRTDAREILAVGIFGNRSRIGDRIERLVERKLHFRAKASGRGVAAGTVVLAGLMFAGALTPRWIAFAQQHQDSFEVASIRLNQSGDDGFIVNFPETGRLIVTNASLRTLIRNAYGAQNDQILGGPPWLDRDKFDIQAKTNGPIREEQEGRLLLNLLVVRFHLRFHQDTRELPIYVMTTAPGGPKFKKHIRDNGFIHQAHGAGRAQIDAARISLGQLAGMVGKQTGRIVQDRTGLDGYYDFTLTWDPDQTTDSQEPSIFVALKEQLGLNLSAAKVPIMVLVIDHAEKPDAN